MNTRITFFIKFFRPLVVLPVILIASTTCFAAPDQFLCGAAEAVACAQDDPCIRGSANSVNLPQLWRVILREKIIVSIREGGEQRTSNILEVIEGEESLVLFGADQGIPWSVFIATSDGKMTLTSSKYNAGFIVHGACSSKILK
jgi:hypothetical protein